jgi:hypothetical protein
MANDELAGRMPRRWSVPALAVIAGLVAAVSVAAVPRAEPAVPAVEQELDEIFVRGTPLWKLRKAIVESEERFYALYNQLNEQDEFDVRCRLEAPLGTRLKGRICRVAFQEVAEAQFAQAMLWGEFWGETVIDPDLLLLARRDEYREHALQVINRDARLLRLVRERESLGRQLAAEYRLRFRRSREPLE